MLSQAASSVSPSLATSSSRTIQLDGGITMRAKVSCPICKNVSVDRVFEEADIYVNQKGEGEKRVGTPLLAFFCQTFGHVFFVRRLDLVDRGT